MSHWSLIVFLRLINHMITFFSLIKKIRTIYLFSCQFFKITYKTVFTVTSQFWKNKSWIYMLMYVDMPNKKTRIL